MRSKQTVTRNGDTFTTISKEQFTSTGYKIDSKTTTATLNHILRTAGVYRRTLDDIEAAAIFMESAMNMFSESETALEYMEVKGIGAIFGMLRDSIASTIQFDFDSGEIIENLDT